MQPFPKKENTPNFANPSVQNVYVQEAKDNKTLLQKELDVNHAEQSLLQKRIQLMKEFMNDLPASDPQYSMMIGQAHMDQIELDELKIRETILIQTLSEKKSN